jgi:YgiT-type zinc finger domain-containing protein
MECLFCHGKEIENREVKEEIKSGDDIIFVTVTVPVCKTCGERYYDRATMHKLENLKKNIEGQKLKVIGKVLEVI